MGLRKRRSDDRQVVTPERRERIIGAVAACGRVHEEPFQARGGEDNEEPRRRASADLPRVGGSAWDEHERPSRRVVDLVAEANTKLAVQNVDDFVEGIMDVERRPRARWIDGLEHGQRAASLLTARFENDLAGEGAVDPMPSACRKMNTVRRHVRLVSNLARLFLFGHCRSKLPRRRGKELVGALELDPLCGSTSCRSCPADARDGYCSGVAGRQRSTFAAGIGAPHAVGGACYSAESGATPGLPAVVGELRPLADLSLVVENS